MSRVKEVERRNWYINAERTDLAPTTLYLIDMTPYPIYIYILGHDFFS